MPRYIDIIGTLQLHAEAVSLVVSVAYFINLLL